jgi:hypothetical protein
MATEEFVQGFYREKQSLLHFYLNRRPPAEESAQQRILMRDGQHLTVQELLENVLDNVFYATLLGLEGSAAIGRTQMRYDLRDSAGNSLNDGELGGYAWQYFQNSGAAPE